MIWSNLNYKSIIYNKSDTREKQKEGNVGGCSQDDGCGVKKKNGILSNWCGAMDASRRDGCKDKEIEPDVPWR